MYSIGIMGVGLKEILDRAFYAIKNTKISAVNGFVIMAVNISLSLILIKVLEAFGILGAYGIPLAYSIASLTGLFILLIMLKKKIGSYAPGLLTTIVKCLISAFVMYACVYFTGILAENILSGDGIMQRLIKLIVPTGIGVIAYAIMLVITRVSYATDFLKKLTARLQKS